MWLGEDEEPACRSKEVTPRLQLAKYSDWSELAVFDVDPRKS